MTEKKHEEQDTFDEVIQAIDQMESEPDRHISIQIDKSLRDAIQAAQKSGQPAGVTITLKVKREAERRMSFSATVTAKLPRPPVAGITLFADMDGHVHKSDPAQLKMPFSTQLANRVAEEN